MYILVNDAAVFTFGKIEDVTESDWDRIFAANVKGYCWTAKHALPSLKRAAQPPGAATTACRAVMLEVDQQPDSDENKRRSESAESPELSKTQ